MIQEEKMISDGFNAGYLMQQHEPELLASILKSNNQENEYIKAITAGKETHLQQRKKEPEKEKAREALIKQQRQIREQKKTKKRGR